jgi:D-alanyl-D-alanine carboxypeptidase
MLSKNKAVKSKMHKRTLLSMKKAKKKKLLFSLSIALIITLVAFLALPKNKKTVSYTNTNTRRAPSTKTTPSFNKSLYSTDEASSLWVVVNKGRVLPSSYVPQKLTVPDVPLRLGSASDEMHIRSDAAAALAKMAQDAKQEGINLMLASGYRSYSNQTSTYAGFVRNDGVLKADTYSARPGHSEHQTGLAADIEPTNKKCELEQCFETTTEGQWLAANSYKYGFIIRYQKDTESLTGYEFEPWHVRFVGQELASEIMSQHQTLEQFFGLPNYTTYPKNSYEIKNI